MLITCKLLAKAPQRYVFGPIHVTTMCKLYTNMHKTCHAPAHLCQDTSMTYEKDTHLVHIINWSRTWLVQKHASYAKRHNKSRLWQLQVQKHAYLCKTSTQTCQSMHICVFRLAPVHLFVQLAKTTCTCLSQNMLRPTHVELHILRVQIHTHSKLFTAFCYTISLIYAC